MEHAYKHLSQSYVIQRDLVLMECVKCVMQGGLVKGKKKKGERGEGPK
jgi:hypothetical protein